MRSTFNSVVEFTLCVAIFSSLGCSSEYEKTLEGSVGGGQKARNKRELNFGETMPGTLPAGTGGSATTASSPTPTPCPTPATIPGDVTIIVTVSKLYGGGGSVTCPACGSAPTIIPSTQPDFEELQWTVAANLLNPSGGGLDFIGTADAGSWAGIPTSPALKGGTQGETDGTTSKFNGKFKMANPFQVCYGNPYSGTHAAAIAFFFMNKVPPAPAPVPVGPLPVFMPLPPATTVTPLVIPTVTVPK